MFSQKNIFRLVLTFLTLILFAYYFFENREEFNKLQNLTIFQFFLIALGQLLVVAANVGILITIGLLAGKRIGTTEASRITAYSSVINFFGFLQGGLGFRGVYLKRYYRVSYKFYAALTTLQYTILFALVGIIIAFGILTIEGQWNLEIYALISIFSLLGFGFILRNRISAWLNSSPFSKVTSIKISWKYVLILIVISLIQLVGSSLAFGTELNAVGASFSIGALLIYTGVAYLSLLVALTPGAIGIREGMLLIVQGQMNLSASDIVLSSTLDRLIYFLLLICFVPIAISWKRQFK